MSLLDDIPGLIDDALQSADLYRDATLGKVAPGTRTPGNETGGTNPTITPFACRGFITGYDAKEIAFSNSLIQSSDRKIILLGGSLPNGITPEKNDKVTIQDADGVSRTFTIVTSPDFDAAGAAFTCQGRK